VDLASAGRILGGGKKLAITIDDVRQAAEVIKAGVQRTPARYASTLSMISGADIFLKFENFQFTASFKERGALNKLLSLTLEERTHGVVAMSAGNHAQAVAYHAGLLGIRATIVMPHATPFNKIKHTRDFGATVIVNGETLSDAQNKAVEIASTQGMIFVHPYDDPFIIAGQGTVALELITEWPHLDMLVVPIGGGGLISGMAVAAKALKPDIEIYGVQSALFPSMAEAVFGGPPGCWGNTIAEGIAVMRPGLLTRQIVRALVKDILLVEEHHIESALAQLLEVEKIVAEGAAAAALAAVMTNGARFAGKKVGIVLSGGNIDMRLLSNVIMRELSREGRIQSLLIEIEDRPGLLAKIANIISEAGGNILDVSHNRMATDRPAKSTALGVTLESRDAAHAYAIRARLEAAGFTLRTAGPTTILSKQVKGPHV